jgi:hypothetical protein
MASAARRGAGNARPPPSSRPAQALASPLSVMPSALRAACPAQRQQFHSFADDCLDHAVCALVAGPEPCPRCPDDRLRPVTIRYVPGQLVHCLPQARLEGPAGVARDDGSQPGVPDGGLLSRGQARRFPRPRCPPGGLALRQLGPVLPACSSRQAADRHWPLQAYAVLPTGLSSTGPPQASQGQGYFVSPSPALTVALPVRSRGLLMCTEDTGASTGAGLRMPPGRSPPAVT